MGRVVNWWVQRSQRINKYTWKMRCIMTKRKRWEEVHMLCWKKKAVHINKSAGSSGNLWQNIRCERSEENKKTKKKKQQKPSKNTEWRTAHVQEYDWSQAYMSSMSSSSSIGWEMGGGLVIVSALSLTTRSESGSQKSHEWASGRAAQGTVRWS